MTTQTSKLRSRKMWLLWLAPLLVPILIFALRYYPQTVTIREYSVKPKAPVPQPYALLSAALIRYPYANEFKIRTGTRGTRTRTPDFTWLAYNRATRALDETSQTLSTAYLKSWSNVSESAIESVAEAERRQTRAGRYSPSVFFSTRILKQQGAKSISKEIIS